MNEIMKKTFEFIDVLDDSILMKELEVYRDKVIENVELQELIRKANNSEDEYLKMDIKRRLYKNKDYQLYMERYQEVMYLVLDINYRFRKLVGKGSCFC